MKKLLLCLTAICFIAISCEQENPLVPEPNQIDELASKTISSSEFKNLNIPTSSLTVEKSQFINADENSILIPYKGIDDRKGVIALFDKDYQIRIVATYEVITETPIENIHDELSDGTFSGEFHFANEDIEVNIDMEKSKIISSRTNRKPSNTRTETCNNITEPGGAADCAGARLTNMNWLDKAFCYSSFIPCMAQLTASCWLDDCNVSPPSPS